MAIKIIYHDNCMDGFASAYVAWRYFNSQNFAKDKKVEYIPMKFGSFKEGAIDKGDSVYIFDINFPNNILLDLYDKCESIILFDHHESHGNDLLQLHFTNIDYDESGASLAWKYFYPDQPMPLLIQYVRNRDLWLWEMENDKEVTAYISSLPYNFLEWAELEHRVSCHIEECIEYGGIILNYQSNIVESLIKDAKFARVLGFEVPIVNAPLLQSEIGAALLHRFPDAPFSVVFHVLPNGKRKYSLRSLPNKMNVGLLAKEYGGGGHPCAAGVVV